MLSFRLQAILHKNRGNTHTIIIIIIHIWYAIYVGRETKRSVKKGKKTSLIIHEKPAYFHTIARIFKYTAKQLILFIKENRCTNTYKQKKGELHVYDITFTKRTVLLIL